MAFKYPDNHHKTFIMGDPAPEAEGWVLRPQTELRTRLNERIITKLKVKDFPNRRDHQCPNRRDHQ